MDLSHITTLAELRAAVEAFEGCSLKASANRTVFSDGNPQGGIVLIGEAPGAQEDAQGKPFVGRSGQLLDKMLAEINLSRNTADKGGVYITNTVFWRPPDNRTPTPAEILSCRPFLLKHLELLRPKIIVMVGGTAVKAVLQTKDGIGQFRNRWLEFDVPGYGKVPTLATFHPAYLLRNPPAKKEAWADFLMLREKVEQLGLLPERATAA
ncbi:MAG: uracil-DNA glycosylase [Blastochloris viridis]|uniref:Type-4 uracil-DNA glycosylase n=1 Tax=Blastochloris viridis TaxID=1079 RepID=A0A6N4R5T0_BLAVI|nr:MAG: uracil-DNA glycosylase [Blastochloris viridis]